MILRLLLWSAQGGYLIIRPLVIRFMVAHRVDRTGARMWMISTHATRPLPAELGPGPDVLASASLEDAIIISSLLESTSSTHFAHALCILFFGVAFIRNTTRRTRLLGGGATF